MKQGDLEVIACEFSFDPLLKTLFLSVVKFLEKRRKTLISRGRSISELNKWYFTPYELAEQIYSKKEEIYAAVDNQHNVEIEISRRL